MMKQGTYIASTTIDGSVMFRVDGTPYTLRKGKDIEVFIPTRAKVTYPATFMKLTFKDGSNVVSKVPAKSESDTEVKKEIKAEAKVAPVKTEAKETEAKVAPVKTEAKETAKVAPKKRTTRKSPVKIETEEK